MGKPVPKTKKTDLPRRSAIWPLRSLAVVRKSVSHVKDGMDAASAAPWFPLIIHHSAEFVNSFRAFCRKNYRRYWPKNLERLYSGENMLANCCLAVGCLTVRACLFPRSALSPPTAELPQRGSLSHHLFRKFLSRQAFSQGSPSGGAPAKRVRGLTRKVARTIRQTIRQTQI